MAQLSGLRTTTLLLSRRWDCGEGPLETLPHPLEKGGGGVGGYIQQDGLDHRGMSPSHQGRLKSHSRDRGGVGGGGGGGLLRNKNSPVHSILAPTPAGPTPVYVRAGHQSWHHQQQQQQNTIHALQVSQEPPKSASSPSVAREEDPKSAEDNVKGSSEDPAEVEARERYDDDSYVMDEDETD